MWVDNVASISIEKLVNDWAEDLWDITPEELKRGLESSKSEKYPPTIENFREHCRPTKENEVVPFSGMYLPISPLPKEPSTLKKEQVDEIFNNLKKIVSGE